MAQVTQCDRCKRASEYTIVSEADGDEIYRPREVELPQTYNDEDSDDARCIATYQLCPRCLKSLEAWYDRGVKE